MKNKNKNEKEKEKREILNAALSVFLYSSWLDSDLCRAELEVLVGGRQRGTEKGKKPQKNYLKEKSGPAQEHRTGRSQIFEPCLQRNK